MKILNLTDQVLEIYTGDKRHVGTNLVIKPDDTLTVYFSPATEERVREMIKNCDNAMILMS